jgi:hypothetical protein
MMVALQLLWLHAEVGPMTLMKRRFRWFLLVMLSLGFLAASPASADHRGKSSEHSRSSKSWKSWGGEKYYRHHHRSRHHRRHYHRPGCGHPGGQPGGIPELDPGLFGSAAVLLIGGTLVLHGRRRAEQTT